MRTTLSSIILSFGLLLASGPSLAQPVAPLVPRLDPPMTAEVFIRFHEALGQGLATGGLKVMAAQAVRDKLNLAVETAGCFSSGCRSTAKDLLKVDRLAVANVLKEGKDYTIEVELYRDQTLLGRGKARCEICSTNEAVETLQQVAEELGTRTEEPPPMDQPPPMPAATPKPAPAAAPLPGPAPAPAAKPAAPPAATPAAKPAARPAAKPRTVLKPIVKSAPSSETGDEEDDRNPLLLWGGVGAGVAAVLSIGAAIPLLVIDGTGAVCKANATTTADCSEIYDTDKGGWALVGIGGAAAVASGVLLYLYYSGKPKERSSAGISNFLLSPTPSGGIVMGAGGQF